MNNHYDVYVQTLTEEIIFSRVSGDELEREKRRLEVTNPRSKIKIVPARPDTFFDKDFGIDY